MFINFLFQHDWGRECVNKLFRKRNSATNCARLFVHFETPFGVCNRARLFSALFGHAVADEYANVRRDGDADCILCTYRSKLTVTDYKPHAACRTGCAHWQYTTHTPTTDDIKTTAPNTVGLYVNQWIDASDWFGRLWEWFGDERTILKKKTWNVHRRYHFSVKWYTLSFISIDYCQSCFRYYS